MNEAGTQAAAPAHVAAAAVAPAAGRRGFAARALRHPSFVAGALLVALLLLAAALSLFWTPHSPTDIDVPNKLAGPSASHWLGTDSLGRDVASLLLVGAQNSIAVGFIAVGIGLLAGVALGALGLAAGAVGVATARRAAPRTAV